MVTIAIVGILASIALPAFSSYRVKAFNASAKSYLQFISTVQESNYSHLGGYTSIAPGQGPGPTGLTPGTTVPDGVGYAVGTFPVPSTSNYVAFTGHFRGDSVFAATNQQTQKLVRKRKPSLSASDDAQTENTTAPLPAGWGVPL